ncbi:MAG: hypothetical protein JWQ01_1532 [Massilia sp.]|nr:hypothetical protein [Massilia sp.]
MKKLVFMLALLVGGAAQAQVHFDSGSAHPNNPHAALRDSGRHHHVVPVKARPRLARCRDGSRRVARMCKRHGGIAHR